MLVSETRQPIPIHMSQHVVWFPWLLLPSPLLPLLLLLLSHTQKRDHDQFLVRLKDVLPSKQQLLQDLQANAAQQFDLQVCVCEGKHNS